MSTSSLLSLPKDILILIPDFLHTIEDYTSFSSTCTVLRGCAATASPRAILRLAVAQSSTFFRPSPHFLATATARELGHWARTSEANERELALRLENGVDGLMSLALEHCGLTMQRIRELYEMRFSIINPVTDIIDKCVGKQWYSTPDFWNGGVDDAYTISADAPTTLFHLALYGELFGPDFETFLSSVPKRRLSVETRLEFIKYCVPDYATFQCAQSAWDAKLPDGRLDPRRAVKATGPYHKDAGWLRDSNNIALVWVIQSSRFLPHWREMRARAGVKEFKDDLEDHWHYYDEGGSAAWKQRMLESVIISQGLQGLGMIRPQLQQSWYEKVRMWREAIDVMEKEPEWTRVGRQATLDYPFLLGDLSICGSRYVSGT